MGVYINMEMPKNCGECPMICEDDLCRITKGGRTLAERPPHCPLIAIPPHGQLIDADALTDVIESTGWYHQAPNKEMVHGANSAEHQAWYKEQDIFAAVENAPTIIEAEDNTDLFTKGHLHLGYVEEGE